MRGKLTKRELELTIAVSNGETVRTWAKSIGISYKTAECHAYTAKQKSGTATLPHHVARCIRLGVIQ